MHRDERRLRHGALGPRPERPRENPFVADATADWSKALGLEQGGAEGNADEAVSMLVDNGRIVKLNVEEPGKLKSPMPGRCSSSSVTEGGRRRRRRGRHVHRCLYVDEASGDFWNGKVPTDVADRARGCVAGLRAAVPDLARIAVLVDGTTAGTNALLERRGALVGTIGRGFGDVLELRPRDRPISGACSAATSRSSAEPDVEVDSGPTPTVPSAKPSTKRGRSRARKLRDAGAEVRATSRSTRTSTRPTSSAPAPPPRAWSDERIVTSSGSPEDPRVRRASTTVLDGYLQPVIDRYVGALDARCSTKASPATC